MKTIPQKRLNFYRMLLYSRHAWAQCTTYFAVISLVRTCVLWPWKDTFSHVLNLRTLSISFQWRYNGMCTNFSLYPGNALVWVLENGGFLPSEVSCILATVLIWVVGERCVLFKSWFAALCEVFRMSSVPPGDMVWLRVNVFTSHCTCFVIN